ncbi:MAG: hypothetical protein K0R18_183 [Bacillales bacterium]|jgi:hypothetical protein|nr:hypothetical protein [Bacillales bacterium]
MGAEPGRIDYKKNDRVIDSAWDEFSEYIGENKIKTPLALEEFEQIFSELNKNGEYTMWKDLILQSFRYDSYSWPLVERTLS